MPFWAPGRVVVGSFLAGASGGAAWGPSGLFSPPCLFGPVLVPAARGGSTASRMGPFSLFCFSYFSYFSFFFVVRFFSFLSPCWVGVRGGLFGALGVCLVVGGWLVGFWGVLLLLVLFCVVVVRLS